MTQLELELVFAQEPLLSREGVGLGLGFKRAKTPEAVRQAYRDGKDRLRERLDVISKVVEVMRPVEKTAKVGPRSRGGSYYLKHVVEDILGQYVSNAELIVACIQLGFSYRKASVMMDNPSNPNVLFNMASKSLKALAARRQQALKGGK